MLENISERCLGRQADLSDYLLILIIQVQTSFKQDLLKKFSYKYTRRHAAKKTDGVTGFFFFGRVFSSDADSTGYNTSKQATQGTGGINLRVL